MQHDKMNHGTHTPTNSPDFAMKKKSSEHDWHEMKCN